MTKTSSDYVKEAMVVRSQDINRILSDMGEKIMVDYEQVIRSGKLKDAFVIFKKGCIVSPVLYYSKDWWVKSDYEIADYIREVFYNHLQCDDFDEKCLTKDYFLSNVLPRITSAEDINLLEKERRVYDKILDLAVIYYIPLDSDNEFLKSLSVTEDMLAYRIGMDIRDKLLETSIRNLEKQAKIMSMDNYLGILGCPDSGVPMIIGTNEKMVNGAAVLISSSILDEIREMLGTDKMMILPSSIHEIIALPYIDGEPISDFRDIVKHVNDKIVSSDDQLTDSVYIWDGINLKIAE